MAKFISDSDEWDRLSVLWSKSDIVDDINGIKNKIHYVNRILNQAGLPEVSTLSESEISDYEDQCAELSKYCTEIHSQVEESIDNPFCYGLAKIVDEAYGIHPKDIIVSNGVGIQSLSLVNLIDTVATVDEKLQKAFVDGIEKIEAAEPSKTLQQAIRDAIARYYQGEDIRNIEETDKRTLIRYHEILFPEDAKKLDEFLADIIANNVNNRYVADIRYLSYVAQEPYKSVFFEYLNESKILWYSTSKDSSMYIPPKLPEPLLGAVLAYLVSLHPSVPLNVSSPLFDVEGIVFNNLGIDENDENYKWLLSTFFHENGHAIGDVTGVLSYLNNSADHPLQEALLRDVENNVKRKIAVYTQIPEEIENIYNSIINTGSVFGDIGQDIKENLNKWKSGDWKIGQNILQKMGIEGLTDREIERRDLVIAEYKNELKGDNQVARDVFGGFSFNELVEGDGSIHDNTYWPFMSFLGGIDEAFTGNGMQKMELFAHYFSANMRSDTKEIEALQEYFPEAYEEMDRMIEEMAGNLK